jgi:cytochrome c oxidase subunit 1
MATQWSVDIPGLEPADLRPVKWQLYLSLTGLALGALMGILQALERLDVNLYEEVGLETYYQGLTLHGVALALVFTFTFGNAFCSVTTMKGFGRPLAHRSLSVASTYCAWGGVVLAAWAILANKATVLFTFYAPLQATPAFYLGAVLLVISTWLVLANMLLTLRAWRRDNPASRTPLMAFVSIMSYLMWAIASVGIAIEVLAFILPWSLGLTTTVDPQFTRTLFWFTGHPIVYFWLLPVYVSWYMMLPKWVGGKLYSDGLTRIVFISFLLLIPVGVHHQFTDPGIPFSSKTIQWLLTFGIFYPSLVTAFTVFAALEMGARKRGATGLISWIRKLPWGNPVVSGQLLAGLGFMLGGASGLINASYTVNVVVHNTAFIPGHFHLTVGTAVALSIMAISYWFVPYLTGKELWGRKWAVAQGWMWLAGVLIFSRGQMANGIGGQPRRTEINSAPYAADHDWGVGSVMTGFGGMIMFLSACVFFVVILKTIYNKQRVTAVQEVPVSEVLHGPRIKNVLLDRVGVWVGVAVVLCVIVYGELILHYLPLNSVSEGIRLW